MGYSNKFKMILISSIVAGIVILDQLTKFIVKNLMELYDSISVLGDFFRFTYIENPGMAFGIQMQNKLLFTILSVVAALIVVFYLFHLRNEKIHVIVSLSLILGGAIGNLIDRFAYGRVVDFLDFEFFDLNLPSFSLFFYDFPGYQMTRWPVFNIADSAVTIGMIIITWMILFEKSTKQTPEITV